MCETCPNLRIKTLTQCVIIFNNEDTGTMREICPKFSCKSMPRIGCSALHEVSSN